jgi:hypothetical protein
MNCTDAHLAIGAEPHATTPELEQHLRECAACAEYRREMLALDDQILRALRLDAAALKGDASGRTSMRVVAGQRQDDAEGVGSRAHDTHAPPASARPLSVLRRGWALAASVLFAIGVGIALWAALPRHTLAADIIAHVVSEPQAWRGTETPVSAESLSEILGHSGLRIDSIHQEVLFAQTCFLRGRLVPHFVVRTHAGPVTVLIMPDEKVTEPMRFEENGYTGLLYPHAKGGSIAVLGQSMADPDREVRQFVSAIHFAADE